MHWWLKWLKLFTCIYSFTAHVTTCTVYSLRYNAKFINFLFYCYQILTAFNKLTIMSEILFLQNNYEKTILTNVVILNTLYSQASWLSCLCPLDFLIPKTFKLFGFQIVWIWIYLMEILGRIQDFKLGAHVKKSRRAEGVFRVKNHDFMLKNHIFSNFRGWGGDVCAPPWIRPWCVQPVWGSFFMNRTNICDQSLNIKFDNYCSLNYYNKGGNYYNFATFNFNSPVD